MKNVYDQREVSAIVGISESQIRYWDRVGLVGHIEKKGRLLCFDFKGLVAFRTVKVMLDRGFSTRKIRKWIEQLKRMMPEVEQPLTELRIEVQGGGIVIGKDNLRFTPEGQLLIGFEKGGGETFPLPVDASEELFFQALESEEEENWEGAQKKYEAALAIRPDYPDALVNLGNIRHHLGDIESAEACYRSALRVDPDHVEANYNFANVLEEKGRLDDAILFYFKSIHEDPDFADAHFNLGRVLERGGDLAQARKHWRIYLHLDPTSEWADYLRRRLDEEPS
jgi:tetratricopeptide (TPR) repeat protein